jgi:hypothetical protein
VWIAIRADGDECETKPCYPVAVDLAGGDEDRLATLFECKTDGEEWL